MWQGILWEHTGSNRGPSACKADALNQLSYAPIILNFFTQTLSILNRKGLNHHDSHRESHAPIILKFNYAPFQIWSANIAAESISAKKLFGLGELFLALHQIHAPKLIFIQFSGCMIIVNTHVSYQK